jgi:predicted metal-dependent hydrolase
VFPEGEEFFVRSVRHHRDRVTDPVLRRQVAGFIGQESVHGREHRVLNDRLDQLGYPTKRYERLTRWGLAARERIVPPIANLAATAAMEHFTATLAELALSDAEARRLPGPVVGEVFTWHALEESEHKAVAFDVYRAAGGSERLRIWTMKAIRVGFIVSMSLLTFLSLLGDRAAYRPGRLRRSWRNFRRTPMFRREVWDQLRAYDRVGFHPDDFDTGALVEHWQAELFGDEGSLTPLLAGASV